MGVMLVGVSIAIVMSVIINNMSDKRQYPTSWPLLTSIKKKIVTRKLFDIVLFGAILVPCNDLILTIRSNGTSNMCASRIFAVVIRGGS